MVSEPEQVAEHPSFRFVCSGCRAFRDQQIRNKDARFIKCVCGEKAEKIDNSPKDKDERIKWWTYPNGEYAPGKFSDNPDAGAAIGRMMGMGGTSSKESKPTGFLGRIFQAVKYILGRV
ncbi:hypothetical protein LCGC14_0581800 [marine sediment metagenome]|uniref:Uncharacterized protein n=1 Tax=marine sediment metagenome TaxID=412755 RepID=A0A0F9RG85_9ZZZZ